MKTLFGSFLALALVASAAHAQSNPFIDKGASAAFTATAASCVAGGVSGVGAPLLVPITGVDTVSITFRNTFVGTAQVKLLPNDQTSTSGAYIQPTIWTPATGGGPVSSFTTTGTWVGRVAGYRQLCIYLSAYTSGTVNVFVDGSLRSSGSSFPLVGHPNAIQCYLAATTSTTSVQITGCEVQTGKSIYVTSVTLTGDAVSTTSNPATLQSGTSTACTGPHVLFSCYHPAVQSCSQTFNPPLKATVSEGLCLLDGVTGTKTATISGYVAP